MKLALSILLCSMLTAMAPQTFSGATLKGMSSSPVAASNDPVFNSITHCWHLEENSGSPRIDTVGGKTLTESVAVPRATGIHGNAADFRSLTTGKMSSSAFTISFPFSIAYWIKASDALSEGDVRDVLDKSDSGDGEVFSRVNVLSSNYRMLGQAGADCDTFGGSAISSFLNNWHLIVMTFDTSGNNCNLYVDAVLDPDSGIQSCPTSSDGVFALGNALGGGAIGGLVDEVMIFNTDIGQAGATALLTHFYTP